MNYIYKGDLLDRVFDSDPVIRHVMLHEHKLGCPYDGVYFCSKDYPRKSFLNQIKGGRSENRSKNIYFRNVLISEYFEVCWQCLNSSQWMTRVRINPSVLEISPHGIELLLSMIFDNIHSVFIHSFDEKIDITTLSLSEVVSSLHVPYSRNTNSNFLNTGTYYCGSRKGQQCKIYDKAKQMKVKNKTITRIEKTKKYSTNSRPSLNEFMQWKDSKAITSLVLMDVSKIDKRTALGKIIQQHKTLQEAYNSMDKALRRKLIRHPAYLNPSINLGDEFNSQLIKWHTVSSKNVKVV